MTSSLDKFRKRFGEGEVLIKEGETDSRILLPLAGKLDVIVQGNKVNTIDASANQDFIGELGALLGTPRTATIVAATDCLVLCLPKLDIETVLKQSPSLGAKLVMSLCKKLYSSTTALAEFQGKNDSVINSGNTETSLRNYMKGLLFLMQQAADEGSAGLRLLDYFLHTNPWGLQHGEEALLLDYRLFGNDDDADEGDDDADADGE